MLFAWQLQCTHFKTKLERQQLCSQLQHIQLHAVQWMRASRVIMLLIV